jgi:hypothetical protein
MGIMHLRWAGSGAYGEACASRNPVWSRLKVLKLEILSPYTEGRLSTCQKRLFEKIFVDYLQSFTRILIQLDLSWLGAAGPNPFVVEDGHKAMELTKSWSRLRELRLNNVISNCCISTIKQLAPNLQTLAVVVDLPKAGDRMRKQWVDYRGQELEDNDNSDWMTLQNVRISAIPKPLFQHRFA